MLEQSRPRRSSPPASPSFGCFVRYAEPSAQRVRRRCSAGTSSSSMASTARSSHATSRTSAARSSRAVRPRSPASRPTTPPIILRFLDTGAHGVHVPWVNSAADAERAVRSVKYTPRGDPRPGRQPRVRVGLARADRRVRRTGEPRDPGGDPDRDAGRGRRDRRLPRDRRRSTCCSSARPTCRSRSVIPADLRHPDVLAAMERVADAVVGSDKALGIYAGTVDMTKDMAGPGRPLLHDGARAVPARWDAAHLRDCEADAMETIRLTIAQAIVRWLLAQRTADRRRGHADLRRRVRDLRARQRDRRWPRRSSRCRTACRPGAARTSSRWRWPPWPTPRRCAGGGS